MNVKGLHSYYIWSLLMVYNHCTVRRKAFENKDYHFGELVQVILGGIYPNVAINIQT